MTSQDVCSVSKCGQDATHYLIYRDDRIHSRWCKEHYDKIGRAKENDAIIGVTVDEYSNLTGAKPKAAASPAKRTQPTANLPAAVDYPSPENREREPATSVVARQSNHSRASERGRDVTVSERDVAAERAAVANAALQEMYALAARGSTMPFPQSVQDALTMPVDPSQVQIKETGEVHVPHIEYRLRLDLAFGCGGWALIPLGDPIVEGNDIVVHCYLKAWDRFIGDGWGGARKFDGNQKQDWTDVVETAKSIALVRCCKALPMFRELWQKEWGDAWKEKNAEFVEKWKGSTQKAWRKKGEAMQHFDVRPGRQSVGEYSKPLRAEDEANEHMEAMRQERVSGRLREVSQPASESEFYDDGREIEDAEIR